MRSDVGLTYWPGLMCVSSTLSCSFYSPPVGIQHPANPKSVLIDHPRDNLWSPNYDSDILHHIAVKGVDYSMPWHRTRHDNMRNNQSLRSNHVCCYWAITGLLRCIAVLVESACWEGAQDGPYKNRLHVTSKVHPTTERTCHLLRGVKKSSDEKSLRS